MEWIEVTGRTVDDAKELALDRLGVVEDELEFEIVDEPKSGLFGRIGRTEARIRARVKPLSREKPGDRRRRRTRQGGRARRETSSKGAGTSEAKSSKRADSSRSETDDREPARAGASTGRQRPRRRRGGGGSGSVTANSGGSPATSAAQEESNMEDDVSVEDQAKAAQQFTVGLVEAFGAKGEVVTEVRDDAIFVDINGDDLGLLVGPKGATLSALEEIVRAVVQRSTSGHSARVHVDVGGYRQRRRDALAEFVRDIADQVKDEGVERALEPMSPPDRKVVHDTVAELEGVTTASIGEEPRRRVVIRPA